MLPSVALQAAMPRGVPPQPPQPAVVVVSPGGLSVSNGSRFVVIPRPDMALERGGGIPILHESVRGPGREPRSPNNAVTGQ
jgi:hypothetical protein